MGRDGQSPASFTSPSGDRPSQWHRDQRHRGHRALPSSVYDNSTFPSTIVTEVRSPTPHTHIHTHRVSMEKGFQMGPCRKGNVGLQGQEKCLSSCGPKRSVGEGDDSTPLESQPEGG